MVSNCEKVKKIVSLKIIDGEGLGNKSSRIFCVLESFWLLDLTLPILWIDCGGERVRKRRKRISSIDIFAAVLKFLISP